MSKGARAVFLDRDGVINAVVLHDGRPCSPRMLEEFRIEADAGEALKLLRERGFRLFVVSNQPDLARGLLKPETAEAMSAAIASALPVERVVVCAHDDADGCDCRKPKPGMLLALAAQEHLDLTRSFLIGDTWKDVVAARRAGCRAILIRRHYNRGVEATHYCYGLKQAARLIVELYGNDG